MARLLHALLLMALCAACAGEIEGKPAVAAVAGGDPGVLPSPAPAMQPPPLVTYKFGSGYAPYFRQAGVNSSKYSGNGTTVATGKGPVTLISA
jgi:hypothetical protein